MENGLPTACHIERLCCVTMKSRQFGSISHIVLLSLPVGTSCSPGPQSSHKTCGAICKMFPKITWKQPSWVIAIMLPNSILKCSVGKY